MTEKNSEEKHVHEYNVDEIYPLRNFYKVIVKMKCECGKEEWDIADGVRCV
jgi:hypothetical protein